MDATCCPVQADTISAVTSFGGFSSVPQSHKAIAEAFRMLKPGGWIFTLEVLPDKEAYAKLPEKVRSNIRTKMNVEKNWETILSESGFVDISSIETDRRLLKKGESTLADICYEHNIEISILFYLIKARKVRL